MVKNIFKIAWRTFTKNKIFAVINILGLALGITSCLIIYLIACFEFGYDTFHKDKERIYRAVSIMQKQDGDKQYAARVPDPVAATIRNEFTGVEAVAVFHNFYSSVTIPDSKESKRFDAPKNDEPSEIIVTDPDYFNIIQYKWLAGSSTSFKNPFHVVLTENKAQKYFGSIPWSEMIGKEIIYSDSIRVTVCGIVKDFSKNSDFIFKEFISFATLQKSFLREQSKLDNWHNFSPLSQTFVKLAAGSSTAQFQKQMAALVKRKMYAGPDFKVAVELQPLSDIHFNAVYGDAYCSRTHIPTLYGLISIAIFILIIAAINFINLSTAQSARRAKEIGIRKVLGSNRSGLVWQFLSETFILTFFAVIISLVITPTLLLAFHSFVPDGVRLQFNLSTIFFLAIITIITSLLAGLYPAKFLSSYLPVITLKGAGIQSNNSKNYLRKGLIVFQFTVSLALIISSLIIGKQINYALNKDMGFSKDAIITIPTNFNYPKDKKELFADQIRSITGVRTVSTAIGTPIEKRHSQTWIKCSDISEKEVASEYQTCDENFLSLFQIKLLAGRNIIASDTMKEFLINETCAKKIGFINSENAIGKIVEIGSSDASSPKKGAIVGVIADFHSQSLHEPIAPTFITESNNFSRVVAIKLATENKQVADFKQTIAEIEKRWKNIYPNEKFEYRFFDAIVANFYAKEQKTELIINTAMAIAIVISCMGLFGLATFTAQQRTKEIGIRKLLGASVTGIVSMLSRDFLKPVLLAIIIASPIAYYLGHQWLQDFAYRIHISGWIFLTAALIAIVIAVITVSFQALKSALANPVKSLRTE